MKVRCVDAGGFPLTVGKIYVVVASTVDQYEVVDDFGTSSRYRQSRFELVADAALPVDSSARKSIPLCSGVLDYFPAALAEVAKVSKAGNDKHNPGQPLHHARGKSTDHADCIARHLAERGQIDPSDGLSHTAHLAWRALALLQEELEAKGAPMARGAKP